jgi:putative isomerase
MTYHLTHVPFSTFGSWLSIAPTSKLHETTPIDIHNLYLRSHHGARPGVLRAFLELRPLDEKLQHPKMALHLYMAPTKLLWTDETGKVIELCFDTPDCLRLRGKGVGLALTALYETALFRQDKAVVLNVFDVSRRFVLEPLCGKVQTHGAWRPELKDKATLSILPDETGTWELALTEVKSTFTAKPHRPFEECQSERLASFQDWLEKTPAAPAQWQTTRELAAYVNWSSVVNAQGHLKRPAMLMSKGWMSAVWSWDHCFNALALAETNNDLAWEQLLVIADHQDEHGCYPDSANDVEVIYNYTKPPIHGWTVRELLKTSAPSKETLETLYTSLSRLTQWWLTRRRETGQALPYYLHGNDSGWDNCTMFDQGVPLVAPDLATFLILQMDTLAQLAKGLGTKEESYWKAEADTLLESLLSELWTGKRFIAKQVQTGQDVASDTLLYCMPLLLGERLPKTIQQQLAEQVKTFLTPYGLATEHPNSSHYLADGYWRGPIWAPSTYLVAKGLESCGYSELALDISKRFCEMCAKSGFAENFDALTGEGLRDKAYTWTSSVFLLLAHEVLEAETILTRLQKT